MPDQTLSCRLLGLLDFVSPSWSKCDGTSLADDERQLRYRLRNGQVRFATNAFFFQEGHAERYETARYGLFRVNATGELLLVAMYDDELNRLGDRAR
ncbi:GDYXXLXY domain-containing protein [Halomonas sp. SpR8]|uniref:GDYXXLXY domain-containing protein n=1 Tax=Halomonas sp. SpR8 TaxID=3050463 RepID=UPI0027E54EDC|nr:GDYXXLXY domain-containing protein [Halomonas sp. SpR8]MDQ7727848.1 GDYXXLXY domain-containing protein [Halomonas sp. SpR8]